MSDSRKPVHFVGVYGVGMSALAQFHALSGGIATGSDRFHDQGEAGGIKAALESAGVRLFGQNGSGVFKGVEAVVVSTAIEDGNPDIAAAKRLGVPIVHRADWLAGIVASRRTLAVAGTSGKSTVSAMLYSILEANGASPSVITGAALHALEGQGVLGNAKSGSSPLLVIEADESDGSLVKYAPWLGLLLNLGRDHKEVEEVSEIFRAFRGRCERFVVNADDPALQEFQDGAVSFGFNAGSFRGSGLVLEPGSSRFHVEGIEFRIPLPGRYNAENALAAACAASEAGVSLEGSARALKSYRGVYRRYDVVGEAGGVTVVDDYAHNPDKIKAVLAAARAQAKGRLLAVFQPHGFGPLRFLRNDLVEAFAFSLKKNDVLWLPPVFYAGGTAAKDINSDALALPLSARGFDARFAERRSQIPAAIADEAKDGDVVLLLGARDPSLSAFARSVFEAVKERSGAAA